MANRKCIYLTEGECEEKLVNALKVKPALVIPGKVKRFNVIQNELPASILMTFDPGSIVVLVFDTDKDETSHLKKNIQMLKRLCSQVEVLTIAQVLNFEDEIESATDVIKAQNLTKSDTISDFKSAVNHMKDLEFRRSLDRHKLDITRLWVKKPPKAFSFISQGSEKIKDAK